MREETWNSQVFGNTAKHFIAGLAEKPKKTTAEPEVVEVQFVNPADNPENVDKAPTSSGTSAKFKKPATPTPTPTPPPKKNLQKKKRARKQLTQEEKDAMFKEREEKRAIRVKMEGILWPKTHHFERHLRKTGREGGEPQAHIGHLMLKTSFLKLWDDVIGKLNGKAPHPNVLRKLQDDVIEIAKVQNPRTGPNAMDNSAKRKTRDNSSVGSISFVTAI